MKEFLKIDHHLAKLWASFFVFDLRGRFRIVSNTFSTPIVSKLTCAMTTAYQKPSPTFSVVI